MGWRQKTTTSAGSEPEDLRETHRSRQEGSNGERETRERRTDGMANCWEVNGRHWKMGDAGVHIKPPPHVLS
jgi:hypothetical protein